MEREREIDLNDGRKGGSENRKSSSVFSPLFANFLWLTNLLRVCVQGESSMNETGAALCLMLSRELNEERERERSRKMGENR